MHSLFIIRAKITIFYSCRKIKKAKEKATQCVTFLFSFLNLIARQNVSERSISVIPNYWILKLTPMIMFLSTDLALKNILLDLVTKIYSNLNPASK